MFDGITKPSNHERLSKWSEASDEASLLFGIANAICRDRTIRNFVPSLSQGSSARTQLLGELSESYLLAVFVEQMFPCDSQHVDWLATLRTWLLVTGLRLARHGNVQDRLLRSVSRAVRLACNHDEPWGRLLFALATDCDEVAELNGHLAYRGAQVLEYSKDAYTNSQRPVLNAIVRLARGMEDPDRKLASQISLLSNFPELPPPTVVSDYFLESEAYNSDDAAADIPQFPSMGTTTGRIVSAQVAQTNSYQRQRLTSKSIYLLGAEELHYLPWSWNTITPFEKSVFEDWVDQLIASREHKRQLLGAYLWVSTQSGRSLDRVANYEISDEVSDDWRVASSFDVLHRRPPSRKGDWRPVTDSELAWVTPASDIIRLQLPPNVAKILARSSTRVSNKMLLADLWKFDRSPRATFFELLPRELDRLTPAMIGNALHHRLFALTRDPLFPRIVGSSPQSGLPGACAYYNWDITTVEGHLNNSESSAVEMRLASQIGAGSRLDPLLDMIIESVHRAAKRLEVLRQGNSFTDSHNAYVAYLAMDYYANTGIRPGRDPIESLLHLDFDKCFAFVDEKSSGGARSGRNVLFSTQIVH